MNKSINDSIEGRTIMINPKTSIIQNMTDEEFNNYKYDNHIDYDINEYDSETTIKFASLINIEIPKFSFELPKYSINSKELLCNLSKKGLNKRLNGNVPIEYLNRLEMELEVINSMNFADYFLVVYDFILYAKKNKILIGPGRGSAAGSLVSYSLGITEIDPIKFNLIFERFLNKDRVTMPDIDTDIEYLKRDEVINYVKNKYGKNKVCNIITFGTMQPKLAIRDIGRVLKINTSKIDILSKTIKLENTFKELENNLEYKRLINTDKELEELIIEKRMCNKDIISKMHFDKITIKYPNEILIKFENDIKAFNDNIKSLEYLFNNTRCSINKIMQDMENIIKNPSSIDFLAVRYSFDDDRSRKIKTPNSKRF